MQYILAGLMVLFIIFLADSNQCTCQPTKQQVIEVIKEINITDLGQTSMAELGDLL
jgi:hypothetical protein